MTHCTACSKPIDATAPYCTHCGAAQKPALQSAMPPNMSQTNAKQTHLFQTTSNTFQVRWTYWAWLAVAVTSNFVGGYGYLVGCVVMPYLLVSVFIARKQWQHQQLLDAVNASRQTAPSTNAPSTAPATSSETNHAN